MVSSHNYYLVHTPHLRWAECPDIAWSLVYVDHTCVNVSPPGVSDAAPDPPGLCARLPATARHL